MKINVEWKILAGLLIALCLMAGIGLDSYISIHQLVDNTRRASDAGVVRRNARDILVTMLNLETGARGFVITGEDIYVGEYRTSLGEISSRMAVLSQSIGDSPERRQWFIGLDRAVVAELAIVKHGVQLRQNHDFMAASLDVKTGDGKREMDKIRKLIAEFAAEQDAIIAEQKSRGSQQARKTIWTIGIGSVCGFLFVTASCMLIHNDLARRRRAAEQSENHAVALHRAHDELETRVHERTLELGKSEAQLHTIVENIGEAVVVSDLDGHLLHFNRAALNSMGYASLEEGRRQMTHLVDTFELSGVDGTPWTVEQWPLARILRGEKLHDLEARMRRIGDDWERIFSFGGNIAIDAGGNPVMAVVTFSDITARKRAEVSLREGEERFRTMANSIPQLAWIARADGYIFWYNERWYDYTGTTPEQMEGWGWQSVHDPEALPEVMKRWKAAIDSAQSFEMEFPLRGADGQFRSFLTRVHPFRDSQGRLVQWFGTNTDVDTLKQAEEKVRLLNTDLEHRVLERTAQLLTANNELEAFSYSVSHDLRAPLRSLDGFSQALLEDYAEKKLDAAGQDYLRRIRGASQRMGQLIDDLLNLSRMTRAELTRQTVDLSKMANELMAELQVLEPQRDMNVVIAQGLVAEVDPKLLRIALTNLLSNAWKFTARRPDARIEFGGEGENGSKAFFVRDNGAGFDMAYAGKLFGAFQRLHATDDFPGTGIGLTIVQRIVHRHGGRLWAESAVDHGATFRFTL